MTTRTDRPSVRSALTGRRFLLHYLQMIVAMFVGMFALGWLSMFVEAGVEVNCLLMATWMTIGMAVWMVWKRHSWASTAEMGLAMYLSFAVLFPAYWTGLLDGHGVMLGGHIVMLPAMLVAMLRRREEYLTCPARTDSETP